MKLVKVEDLQREERKYEYEQDQMVVDEYKDDRSESEEWLNWKDWSILGSAVNQRSATIYNLLGRYNKYGTLVEMWLLTTNLRDEHTKPRQIPVIHPQHDRHNDDLIIVPSGIYVPLPRKYKLRGALYGIHYRESLMDLIRITYDAASDESTISHYILFGHNLSEKTTKFYEEQIVKGRFYFCYIP